MSWRRLFAPGGLAKGFEFFLTEGSGLLDMGEARAWSNSLRNRIGLRRRPEPCALFIRNGAAKLAGEAVTPILVRWGVLAPRGLTSHEADAFIPRDGRLWQPLWYE